MSFRWDQKDLPHKGWELIDVIDIREDGISAEDTNYETCMICGNPKIRYVHILKHKEIPNEYRVGRICAIKLTNDYINPKEREKALKNKSNRRSNWIRRKWKISARGNLFLNVEGNNLVIFHDKRSGKYKCKINSKFGTKLYNSINQAKIGLFNKVEELKSKNRWEIKN